MEQDWRSRHETGAICGSTDDRSNDRYLVVLVRDSGAARRILHVQGLSGKEASLLLLLVLIPFIVGLVLISSPARQSLLLILLGILVLTPLFTASRLLTAGMLLCAMPIPINLAGGVSLQTLLLAPLGLALILIKSTKQRSSADLALLSCLLLVVV